MIIHQPLPIIKENNESDFSIKTSYTPYSTKPKYGSFMFWVASIFIICNVLIFQGVNAIQYKSTSEKNIEQCMITTNCIHYTKHLDENIIKCIQDNECYNYIKQEM